MRLTRSQDLLKTPLHELHLHYRASMVPFSGWWMPLTYDHQSILDSVRFTRTKCSLFDVSHMFQTRIYGKDSLAFIQTLIPSNLTKLPVNKSQYTVLLNDRGGIIDDVTIQKINNDYIWIVSNAVTGFNITHFLNTERNKFGADVTLEYEINQGMDQKEVLVALQGPTSANILSEYFKHDFSNLYFSHGVSVRHHDDARYYITRSGYTGEDGFEILMPSHKAMATLTHLLDTYKGELSLAGLGARDILRLEAGLCLYGKDINEGVTPVQAGLGWTVGKDLLKNISSPKFDLLIKELERGADKYRVGIVIDKAIARGSTSFYKVVCKVLGGEKIFLDHREVGHITSGGFSATLMKNIAMGYMESDILKKPDLHHLALQVEIRGQLRQATLASLPFVASKYYRKKS